MIKSTVYYPEERLYMATFPRDFSFKLSPKIYIKHIGFFQYWLFKPPTHKKLTRC